MTSPSAGPEGPPSGWTIRLGDQVHHGTLAALANGTIGVVGGLGPDDVGTRATFVAGAYGESTDGLVRPLPGPWAAGVGRDPADATWQLDLRTGTLCRLDCDGSTTAQRIVSIVRPAITVVRALVDAGDPRPAPLAPPRAPPSLCADHTFDVRRGQDGIHTAVVRGARDAVVAVASQQVVGTERPRLERVVAVARGAGAHASATEALTDAAAVGVDGLLAEHRVAWEARWAGADIEIVGDDEAQRAVRFAIFHLLSCAASTGESAVGARGLTGPGYAGHVFWDTDVYVLPALAALAPAAARSVLEYRIRRLPAARARAAAGGRAGARFPWESADSGEDATPRFGRDLHGDVVPITTGDLSEHITADVAWAASHYLDWTADAAFLTQGGRDLIVETATYWMDRSQHDARGAAHVYDVTGPDEYHECVDDDAYTNLLVRWHLGRAAEVLEQEGDEHRAGALRDRAAALVVGRRPGGGHEQFAGFDALDDVDLRTLGRLPVAADMVLGRERTARSKVLKQPAVLMAHHLLGDALSRADLFADLGAELPRISHGSSLSPAICSAVLARAGRPDDALALFHLAGQVDLLDLTGTTTTGLHLATMGGLWQAAVFGFAGVRLRHGVLDVDPHLPTSWASLRVRFLFRGVPVLVEIDHASVSVRAGRPLAVRVSGVSVDATIDDDLVPGGGRHRSEVTA